MCREVRAFSDEKCVVQGIFIAQFSSIEFLKVLSTKVGIRESDSSAGFATGFEAVFPLPNLPDSRE